MNHSTDHQNKIYPPTDHSSFDNIKKLMRNNEISDNTSKKINKKKLKKKQVNQANPVNSAKPAKQENHFSNSTSDWVLINPIHLHPECDKFSQIGFIGTSNPNPHISKVNDNCILIEYPYFVKDLYSSFKNQPSQIKHQFSLDIGREKFCINGIRYTDPVQVEKMLENMNLTHQKKDLLYMLSTQCSMYLPCLLLYRTYCEERLLSLVTRFIGETKDYKSLNIDIQCGSDSNSKLTKLNYIFVKKRLRIFHLQDESHDMTDFVLDTQIYLDFSQENYVVLSWKEN